MDVIYYNKATALTNKVLLCGSSRIMVVGTSGSGKSTLGKKLSKALGLHNIELDALFWEANWKQTGLPDFRRKIVEELKGKNGFIINGNYSKTKDLTWGKCDVLLWLDYPRWLVMWLVVKRTIFRVCTGKKLWHGNAETLQKAFFSKDSIILWAWNTYRLRKREYAGFVKNNEVGVKTVIILKKPGFARLLLASL